MALGMPAGPFLRELYRKCRKDDILNGAAVLGFFLTLAIFPAMILTMAVLPYLPVDNVDTAIMDLLRQTLPADAASMFTRVVEEVTNEQRGGLLSFGALATLWATSTGMYAIMRQLNVSYDVQEARGFVHARLVAIGLSLMFGALIISAFSLIVLGGVLQDWLGARFGFSDALLMFFAGLRWAIIVAVLLLAFALVYYMAPNVRQRFAYVSVGSVAGTALLLLASLGFAWYARNFGDYSATYGSVGAVIALMIWLYIAGIAILIGSEVNALIAHHSRQGKRDSRHHAARPQHTREQRA
jgi:membrane protein